MPVSEHFKGKGEEVMSDMQGRYGEEKGKRVFYATDNARKKKARGAAVKKMMKSRRT